MAIRKASRQYNSDYMSRLCDDELEQLEERLTALYANATNDVLSDYKKWMDRYEDKYIEMTGKLEAGEITESEFKEWVNRRMVDNKLFTETINSMTDLLVNTDLVAMALVNDELPLIIAQSYNFVQSLGFAAADEAGLSVGTFQIYNAKTVQSLIKDNPDILKYVNKEKDYTFNKERINNEITHSILNGDSIQKTANRLQNVSSMDENSAIRTARTAMTAAENLGRNEGFHDLKEKGVPCRLQWSATHDSRTRDTHILLDGTYQDDNGYFGEGIIDTPIEYPGDPAGDPEEIYNCRCRASLRLNGVDHSQDGELYEKFMKENYPEDWSKVKEQKEAKEQAYQENKTKAEAKAAEKAEEQKEAEKPAFEPATSKQEAEEYAQRFAENVDYKGLSLDKANKVNETLTDLTDKYPITQLNHIDQSSRGKFNAKACGNGLTINGKLIGQNESAISREAKENAINFYKSMYPSGRIPRDMQTKINHLEESLKYPRWTVSSSFDDTVRGTITHEYGHIIADQYFGQINGERYLTIGADEDWKALNYELNSIFEKTKETGDIYSISEYASTNSHEFFAECFALRENGEELPDYVEDFMRRLFNG